MSMLWDWHITNWQTMACRPNLGCCFCKSSLIGTQPCSSVYISLAAAFMLEWQSLDNDHMACESYSAYLPLVLNITSLLTPSLDIIIHSGPGPITSPKLSEDSVDKEEWQEVTMSATWLASLTCCYPLTAIFHPWHTSSSSPEALCSMVTLENARCVLRTVSCSLVQNVSLKQYKGLQFGQIITEMIWGWPQVPS